MFEWKFHFWQCEMDTCSDLFQEWFFFQLFDSHYYYFLIFNFPSLYLIFWKYYWKIFARFAIIIIFFITSDLIYLFWLPHDWKRCFFSYLYYLILLFFIFPNLTLLIPIFLFIIFIIFIRRKEEWLWRKLLKWETDSGTKKFKTAVGEERWNQNKW